MTVRLFSDDSASREAPVSGRESGPPPTLRESKSALLEAAQAAVADQQTKGRARKRLWQENTKTRTAVRSTLGVLTLAGIALLLLRPSWLVGPELPAEPPEIKTASATLALIEAASHLRAYQSATGQLPERLKDAGITDIAIRYQRVDSVNFVIRLAAGDSTLTLRSTDSIKPLITEAVRALGRRG